MKLEKVEIGGIRGKALTSNIGKVYEEFKVTCWQQNNKNEQTPLPSPVRYAKFESIQYFIDIDILQNCLIDIDIF